jgi:hypothetical protein
MFYAAENAHVHQLVEQALFHTDHLVSDVPSHHPTPDGAPAIRRQQRRA